MFALGAGLLLGALGLGVALGQGAPASQEAAGDTLRWQPRGRGDSCNIDGQALWLQFQVAGAAGQRRYVQVQSSGIDRVRRKRR
jgi:hypothetical protein